MKLIKPHIKLQLTSLIFLLLLTLMLASILIIAGLKNNKQLITKTQVFAGDCTGNPDTDMDLGCTNGGNNSCNWICNTRPPGTILTQPSCCETLAKTGNPFACCFDARRRCTQAQCNSIPEGVSKERCGQLWALGYCSSPQPTNPPNPTNPPPPAKSPTPRPNKSPTPRPSIPQPTNAPPGNPPLATVTPYQYPSEPPVISPTAGSPFSFPTGTDNGSDSKHSPVSGFSIIRNFVTGGVSLINNEAPKLLDFFELIFNKVLYYDNQLDSNINVEIKKYFH